MEQGSIVKEMRTALDSMSKDWDKNERVLSSMSQGKCQSGAGESSSFCTAIPSLRPVPLLQSRRTATQAASTPKDRKLRR